MTGLYSVTGAEHRELAGAAARCEAALARFPGGDPDSESGHARARALLAAAAGACRSAAAVFAVDPTLADEPDDTGRLRPVALLGELARQLVPLLRQAVSLHGVDRWPTAERWAEAEACAQRLDELAAYILAVVPRRDHATLVGSRAISQARLAARADAVAEAAALLREAVAAALRLPHPAPQALALAAVADQLAGHAIDLQAQHDADHDVDQEDQDVTRWGRQS